MSAERNQSLRNVGRAALLAAAILAIYLPSTGAGFIRDDFTWIQTSTIETPSDVVKLFVRDTGFYRPLVALSFGLNQFAGLEPLWYGLANLGLLLACVAVFAKLLLDRGFSAGVALFGAGVWALNFHGINMAVLWISGRTALFLVLFSLLAARAALRDSWWWASFWTFLALLSKEEAVLLPAMLVVCRWIDRDTADGERWLRPIVAMAIPLAAYFMLRTSADAWTPLTAPPMYRYTTDPWLLARNVREYADRACTLPVLLTIAALIIGRGWPRIIPRDRRHAVMGLVWLVGGYGITVWLPVRSSLYACFPSIGAAFIAAAVGSAAYDRMSNTRQVRSTFAICVLPFLLLPIYHARNDSYDELGTLSRSVLRELRTLGPTPETSIAITDAPAPPNLASAFGDVLPNALDLFGIPGHVCVQPPSDCRSFRHQDAHQPIHLVVRDGHLWHASGAQVLTP